MNESVNFAPQSTSAESPLSEPRTRNKLRIIFGVFLLLYIIELVPLILVGLGFGLFSGTYLALYLMVKYLTIPFVALLALLKFFSKKQYRHSALILFFAGLVGLIGLEFLISPYGGIIVSRFYVSSLNDTLGKISVSHVTDAPLLSRAGNPIGINLSFDIEFPESGDYTIPFVNAQLDTGESGTHRSFVDGLPRVMASGVPENIKPNEKHSFKGQTVYHMSYTIFPSFTPTTYRAKEGLQRANKNCIDALARGTLDSLEDDLAKRDEPNDYSIDISSFNTSLYSGLTTHKYSLAVFLKSYQKEGYQVCPTY